MIWLPPAVLHVQGIALARALVIVRDAAVAVEASLDVPDVLADVLVIVMDVEEAVEAVPDAMGVRVDVQDVLDVRVNALDAWVDVTEHVKELAWEHHPDAVVQVVQTPVRAAVVVVARAVAVVLINVAEAAMVAAVAVAMAVPEVATAVARVVAEVGAADAEVVVVPHAPGVAVLAQHPVMVVAKLDVLTLAPTPAQPHVQQPVWVLVKDKCMDKHRLLKTNKRRNYMMNNNNAIAEFHIRIEDKDFFNELNRIFHERELYDRAFKSKFEGWERVDITSPSFQQLVDLYTQIDNEYTKITRKLEEKYLLPAVNEKGYHSPTSYFTWEADFSNYTVNIKITHE